MSELSSTPTTSWDPQARPAASNAQPEERGFFADLLLFAWENKIWWIAPTVLILLGLGAMVYWAQGSRIAPFFYALF